MVNVAIIGATGYGGVELIRLLRSHPQVRLAYLSSETYAGRRLCDVYPHFAGMEAELRALDPTAVAAECQFALMAVPSGKAAGGRAEAIGCGCARDRRQSGLPAERSRALSNLVHVRTHASAASWRGRVRHPGMVCGRHRPGTVGCCAGVLQHGGRPGAGAVGGGEADRCDGRCRGWKNGHFRCGADIIEAAVPLPGGEARTYRRTPWVGTGICRRCCRCCGTWGKAGRRG